MADFLFTFLRLWQQLPCSEVDFLISLFYEISRTVVLAEGGGKVSLCACVGELVALVFSEGHRRRRMRERMTLQEILNNTVFA